MANGENSIFRELVYDTGELKSPYPANATFEDKINQIGSTLGIDFIPFTNAPTLAEKRRLRSARTSPAKRERVMVAFRSARTAAESMFLVTAPASTALARAATRAFRETSAESA